MKKNTDDSKTCTACECPCDEHKEHTHDDKKHKKCEHCTDDSHTDHSHECSCNE